LKERGRRPGLLRQVPALGEGNARGASLEAASRRPGRDGGERQAFHVRGIGSCRKRHTKPQRPVRGFPKKQYYVSADLASNCRFFQIERAGRLRFSTEIAFVARSIGRRASS